MSEVNDNDRALNVTDRSMVHVHTYLTNTEVTLQHDHLLTGVTAPACREGLSHVHRIRTRTSYFVANNTGHWHWADVVTGPAIEMPNGGHIHYYTGITSVDEAHSHPFSGITGMSFMREIPYDMPLLQTTTFKGMRDPDE